MLALSGDRQVLGRSCNLQYLMGAKHEHLKGSAPSLGGRRRERGVTSHVSRARRANMLSVSEFVSKSGFDRLVRLLGAACLGGGGRDLEPKSILLGQLGCTTNTSSGLR